MTNRKLFISLAVAGVAVSAVLVLTYFFWISREKIGEDSPINHPNESGQESPTGGVQAAPSAKITGFSWNYKVVSEAGTEPIKSDISLTVAYADNSSERIGLGVITGVCNPEDVTTTLALNSEQLTCYFAGLGHKFRIIESEEEYLIQRRIFEEASPEYNPPVQDFETIATLKKS